MAIPPENWHACECAEVLAVLDSQESGLSAEEAARRLAMHGPNLLPRASGSGPLQMLWRQLNNPISWLLVVAGTLAVLLGKYSDAAVVYGAVVINSVLGFIQEFRADRTIASLAAMVPDTARIVRSGETMTISAAELAPGDIVLLQSGDKVPADLRLLQVKNLLVGEAALTGESLPVAKTLDRVPFDAPLGDRLGMAFSGTLVQQGVASGVVVATGAATELGRINALLQQTGQLETPLTRQLARVSTGITIAVVLVVTVLVVFGIWIKQAPIGEALLVAATLAVAAIPEGLPAVITVALAIGVRRMATRQAVVRHLPAVETLGSTTVICTDKTGTLTRNEMTVQAAWVRGEEYRFAGIGYQPVGEVTHDGRSLSDIPPHLHGLLLGAVLCNDAGVRQEGDEWLISGDPTEAALVVAAAKLGLEASQLRDRCPRLDVVPFESDTKYMATLNRVADGTRLYLKGAPEMVLPRCTDLSAAERELLAEVMTAYGRQALRVIACAERKYDQEQILPTDLDGGFTFCGFIGMLDPPRTEAIDAIRKCHRAGITVKMITGDHPVTAEAIGEELGLVAPGHLSLRGVDLALLDDRQLREVVTDTHVYARVAPEHKLRIVQALQELGQVVAMTGDGVNDAPALKRADIGVAMGITGTAVAKEAAKVILVDDNFASIAAAVEEGRRVYDNLIKSLAFILPTNLGLAGTLSAAMFFFPTVQVAGQRELLLAMSPSQTLWINLVASVTLSIPLAFEVLEPKAMERPPRRPEEPVLSGFIILRLVLVALLMTASACGLFLWEYFRIVGPEPLTLERHLAAMAEAQTISVTCIVFTQIFYLLNCRSLRHSLLSQGIFSNPAIFVGIGVLLLLQVCYIYLPPLQKLFGSTSLDGAAWLHALLGGALVLPLISVEKWWRNR